MPLPMPMPMPVCRFICFRYIYRRHAVEGGSLEKSAAHLLSLARRHGQGEEEEEELVRAHPAALHLLRRPQAHAQPSRQESEEQAVAAGEAKDAALVRAPAAGACAGARRSRGPDQAGGGRAEQARHDRRPRHGGGRRGRCRRRARRRPRGPPHRPAAAGGARDPAAPAVAGAGAGAGARRRRHPVGLPRIPGSACAARAQGPGAAAGADPRAGGAAADGGHAARPRVPHEDPGPAPVQGLRRRPRPPPPPAPGGGRRRRAAAAARQGALRRRPRAAAAAGERQGLGQQHLLQGGDERHDAEQGGGGAQARARAAVRLPAQREAGPPAAAVLLRLHVQGRGGRAEPALELAGGVGRLAAALRQGRPRRAPVALHHQHRHPQEGGGGRRRRRRPARLLGPPLLRPAQAHVGGEGGLLLRRRRGRGAVPGVHGLHRVRQGQVQVHEHAQGALRRRRRLRRLLRALLPVRRPPALADPVHVTHPLHRQRHGLRQVRHHQAARRAAFAAGGGQEPHDAREVTVAEVAGAPQLRLRGSAAPAADGALHPSPLNLAFVMMMMMRCNIRRQCRPSVVPPPL